MPSSISNFERPAPAGAWGRTWLGAVIGACLVLGALEGFVRARGYLPSVKDDVYLWALKRAEASNDNPKTLVVVGSSRAFLGISPERIRKRLPDYDVVDLAVKGTGGRAALSSLAADPHFRGIVIADMAEWHLVDRDSQKPWVATYDRRYRMPGAMIGRWLATFVEARSALLAATGRRTLLALVEKRAWPPPRPMTIQADRSATVDFSLLTPEALNAERKQHLPKKLPQKASTWLKKAATVQAAVHAIQARGGKVVLLRMPVTDLHWTRSQAYCPKDRWWDKLAGKVTATSVHFADYRELSDFSCPDWSHLDQRDAPRFTDNLLGVLEERGVIAREK